MSLVQVSLPPQPVLSQASPLPGSRGTEKALLLRVRLLLPTLPFSACPPTLPFPSSLSWDLQGLCSCQLSLATSQGFWKALITSTSPGLSLSRVRRCSWSHQVASVTSSPCRSSLCWDPCLSSPQPQPPHPTKPRGCALGTGGQQQRAGPTDLGSFLRVRQLSGGSTCPSHGPRSSGALGLSFRNHHTQAEVCFPSEL